MMRDAVAGIGNVQQASETMSDKAKARAQRVSQILNEARQALESAKAQMEETGAAMMEKAAEGAEEVIDSVKPCVARVDESAHARRVAAAARARLRKPRAWRTAASCAAPSQHPREGPAAASPQVYYETAGTP